jgi:histidinol dehydrogenase
MNLKILDLKNSYSYINEKLLKRDKFRTLEVIDKVTKIIDDVRRRSDDAVIEYTKTFDNVDLSQDELIVSEREIERAYQQIDKKYLDSLRVAKRNIEKFQSLQLQPLWFTETTPGVFVGQKYSPLKKVGIYVPGGRASYPSTVLMAAIPAKIAGVDEILITSPPTVNGNVSPSVIVAAKEVGVNKIFKIGGAQAIAAMAYGTAIIPKVEKIIGPGNIYVTTAKLLVSNEVRIDTPAGATEIVILADDSAKPKFIAYDLIAQAEHDPQSYCILISNSDKILNNVKKELNIIIKKSERKEIIEKSISDNGFLIKAKNIQEALDLIDDIAPEHLQLMVNEPFLILNKIRNSGAIFLGDYSPVSIGDYIAGSNHILPTGGFAKTYSGLSVRDFIKNIDIVYSSREGLAKLKPHLSNLAIHEELWGHEKSVEARFDDAKKSDEKKNP